MSVEQTLIVISARKEVTGEKEQLVATVLAKNGLAMVLSNAEGIAYIAIVSRDQLEGRSVFYTSTKNLPVYVSTRPKEPFTLTVNEAFFIKFTADQRYAALDAILLHTSSIKNKEYNIDDRTGGNDLTVFQFYVEKFAKDSEALLEILRGEY